MAKLFDIGNKYVVILLSIIIFFILLVILAVVFSKVKFEKKAEGTVATVINEGELVINYIDGEQIEFNDNKEHTFNISITNSSTNKIYYSIFFSEANLEDIEVTIKDKEGKTINTINEDITNKKLINLLSIDSKETIRYAITLKNKTMTKFKGTLKVVNDSLTTETFSDLILLNNNVVTPKTRVGDEIATTNEGIISTTDNKGTSYYFRGNVDNNYVKINDLIFRIVRINGDSTVRLVYNKVLDKETPYNTNEVAEGKNISSLALLEKSSLESTLNNWLKTYLSEYANLLTNGEYCTDTNFNNEINNIKYAPSYERIFTDKAPDLHCKGTVYNSKIGLLSVDEIVLAGASTNTPNDKYYLYNKDIPGNYVTNSSYFINSSNGVAMINVMSNGALGEGILTTNSSYIRPVININFNAKVKGTGTVEDPYIIVS